MGKLAAHIKSKHVYAFSRFNMLWCCPPLIITEDEVRQGLDIYEEALALVDEALGHAPAQPVEAAARK
jgi:taurine---2-oxoglutarate transaminase